MKGTFEWLEEGLLTMDWTPQPEGEGESAAASTVTAESPEAPSSASVPEPAGQA
jgi:hypothetical protein